MSVSELSFIIDEVSAGVRIDVFLAQQTGYIPSRTAAQRLIEQGAVLVNGHPTRANHRLGQGETVAVHIEPQADAARLEAEDVPLTILYEDASLLAIEKPAGMLTHSAHGALTGTLVNAVLHHCPTLSTVNDENRPGIVHRLDRETSGVILVVKDNEAHEQLARQFEHHRVQKKYIAWVKGKIEFDEGVITAPLGQHPVYFDRKSVADEDDEDGREAETVYRVIRRLDSGAATLVGLFPKTGRTHQLRVHMKYLGHPILGDDKYGDRRSFGRLALHAQSIGFWHPVHRWWMEISTPVPQEFLDFRPGSKSGRE